MAAPTMTVPDRRTDRALHPVAQPVRPGRSLPVLAVVAVATAAALGFALQPLAARLTLPHLGGSAAVWSTSLVFFQLTLLAGYLLAHLLITRCRIRTQMVVVGILAAGAAALALPIQLPGWWLPSVTQPVGSVLLVLLASAGPVFVVTSMMSPLLSHWFAATGHPSAHNPYVLYAASNLGSILGLVAYPFLVEPTLGPVVDLRALPHRYRPRSGPGRAPQPPARCRRGRRPRRGPRGDQWWGGPAPGSGRRHRRRGIRSTGPPRPHRGW